MVLCRSSWFYIPYVINLIVVVNRLLLQTYVDAVHGHKLQLGHANHAWLCLELLDVLCQLAERGYASFVQSILEYPLKNCPEVLLLGLAHINVYFLYFIYLEHICCHAIGYFIFV